MGSSLFARHYSGSRGFFPFLGLLRCFSSPACHCSPYVFRREHARITTRRFPHSEIPGSKVGQHLTRAYRSRPRPSSALGAKASTVCSYSLDQKEHVFTPLWSFQGARDCERPAEAGLSKLNSVHVEVDVVLGEPSAGRPLPKRQHHHRRMGSPRSSRAPDSLERR